MSNEYTFGLLKKKLVLIFLEVNIYSNDRSVGSFTIIFPPICMLLVWFYMHNTR